MITDIFLWIFLGLFIGIVTNIFIASEEGIAEDLLLGTLGALVGGFIFKYLQQVYSLKITFFMYTLVIVWACCAIAIGRLMRKFIK